MRGSCLVSRPSSLEGSELGLQGVDARRALLLQSEGLLLCSLALLVCSGLRGDQRTAFMLTAGVLFCFSVIQRWVSDRKTLS